MKLIKRLVAGVAALVVIFIVALYLFPQEVFNLGVKLQRSGAGLVKKEIVVDGNRIVYLEGGSGTETIVFIHGFGAEKDNWLALARKLPGYRFVIPDIPGFGESHKSYTDRYDINSLVKRLDQFLISMGLKKFYIAGNSMGGNIAGIYTVRYQQKVKGLILIDALGVYSPVKSEAALLIEKGENPLIVKNIEDFRTLISFVFVKKPFIPGPIEGILAARAIRNSKLNTKIFNDIFSEPAILEPHLKSITVPVLIIWGDKDRLLHISSVQVLEKGLKNHTTKILKNCGHSPMMERPVETAEYINSFIGTVR